MGKNQTILNGRSLTTYIITFSILLISFSLFYYLVLYIPTKEKQKKLQDEQNKQNFNNCIEQADNLILTPENLKIIAVSGAFSNGGSGYEKIKKSWEDKCFRMYK